MGAETGDMSGSHRRAGWNRALALIGVGSALTVALVAAWLLPAPITAADRTITGEPEHHTFHTSAVDKQMATWIGPTSWDVRFLGSATLLATAGPWNPVTFRDLTGARPEWTVQDDSTVHGRESPGNISWPYAFSAPGTAFAGVAVGGRSIRIWDVPSGGQRAAIELNGRFIEQLRFTADGKRLAVDWQGNGGTVYQGLFGMTIIDVETGALLASLSVNRYPTVAGTRARAVSADSETLAIRRGTDVLELWDVASAERRGTIRAETSFQGLCISDWVFSPDGSSLSTVLADGAIGLWDAVSLKERFRDERAFATARDLLFFGANWSGLGETAGGPLAFSADSTTLGVACSAGAVHLWNIPSARLQTVLPPPVPPLDSLGVIAFSANGRYLALSGEGTPRARIDRLPAALREVLHRVGDKSGAATIGRLIVWDLTTGRQRLAAQAGGRFTALAFAPDGSRLAAAREETFSIDERLRLGTTVRDLMLWSLE
jgi:WD40 repeat protein